MANKDEFKIRKGKNKAAPLNKNPRTETLQEIQYNNILGEYVNNMNKLENIVRKKEGKGIIHFNNPQQLVKKTRTSCWFHLGWKQRSKARIFSNRSSSPSTQSHLQKNIK